MYFESGSQLNSPARGARIWVTGKLIQSLSHSVMLLVRVRVRVRVSQFQFEFKFDLVD